MAFSEKILDGGDLLKYVDAIEVPKKLA